MDPEDREVNEEREGDECDGPSSEVSPEVFLDVHQYKLVTTSVFRPYHAVSLLDVQNIPKVNKNRDTNSYHSQDAVDFGCPSEGHKGPARKDPDPPIEGKVAVFQINNAP